MNALKSKLFLTVYLILIVAVAFIWYTNQYMRSRARASADAVTITMTPVLEGNPAPGQQFPVDVLIQTSDAAKKISGMDIRFVTEGSVKLFGAADPAPFPNGDTSIYSRVVKTVADDQIRMSYVSFRPDADLGAVVRIQLTAAAGAGGTGVIKIDTAQTQFVGNIATKSYDLGSVGQAAVTIGSGSASKAVVSFNPELLNFQQGDVGSVWIQINQALENKHVSGFHYIVSYDPSVLQILALGDPIDGATQGDGEKFTLVNRSINGTNGTFEVAYVSPLTENELPLRPWIPVAVKAVGTGSGKFIFQKAQVSGNVEGKEFIVEPQSGTYTVSGPDLTCTSDNDCAGNEVCMPGTSRCEQISCPLGAPVCMYTKQENHTCQLLPKPDGSPCGAGKFCASGICVGSLPVTPSVSISPPVTAGNCQVDTDCADAQACLANSCVTLPCNLVESQCTTAKADNHACVLTKKPDGTICDGGECQSGICVQGPTTVPSPTPAGDIGVSLKLRLQGIQGIKEGSHSITAKVTVAGGELGSEQQVRMVTFTPGADGVWSGSTAFDIPEGSGYKMFVKGPQHLQKRICTAKPAETATGTYRCGDFGNIKLTRGTNTLDFSGIVLLTGDIPDQDGIVDAYDLSYLRLNFGSTEEKVLSIADLNQDGIIDTQDYSLVIASLNVKYDEI